MPGIRYYFIAIFLRGKYPAELTEEQRTLFAAWSTLNDDQKEALLLLIKRI